MFVPSGSLLITCVSAPSALNTFSAIAKELPLEQSNPTFTPLNDLVAVEIRYPM